MQITREQAIDLQHDAKWIALKKEMENIIAVETDNLVRCADSDFIRLQERVRALKFCVKLPEIIAEREEDEPEQSNIITR